MLALRVLATFWSGTALPELSLELRLLPWSGGSGARYVCPPTRGVVATPSALCQQCLSAPSLLVVRLLRGPWLPCMLLSRRPHTGPCFCTFVAVFLLAFCVSPTTGVCAVSPGSAQSLARGFAAELTVRPCCSAEVAVVATPFRARFSVVFLSLSCPKLAGV